jgi:hypothetical protein
MKKLLILLLVFSGCTKYIYDTPQKTDRNVSVTLTDVNLGTAPNSGNGDPLRTAFGKVNANNTLIETAFGNIYTETQSETLIGDSLTARLSAATDYSTITYVAADSNTLGNPVTLSYFNANAGSSGSGFDIDKVQFIVGTTAGSPANTDTTFTISQLASKEIKLYRGFDTLYLAYPNRTATNTISGFRYNSSGVIVVKPAWRTGERAYIEGMPTANSNWLTLSSDAAYFSEGFEAAGYDNAVWSETVGVGSFVDEDEVGITPPTGGDSQTLRTQKVSPNFNALSTGTLAVDQVVSYTTFCVYIAAQGLASTEVMGITKLWIDGYGDDMAEISLYVDSFDSNNLKFICEINSDGTGTTSVGWPGAGSAVALNTWYKVNIKYDVTGNTYEIKITPQGGVEAAVMSGSLTDTHPTTGLKIITLGNAGSSETCTIYFDNVGVGTTAYPTF